IRLVKETKRTKFDETVEVHVRTGLNVRHADEQLRGTIALPHGLGKDVKIAVFAKGDKAREAEEAGADVVGGEDLAERIRGGFLDFDVVLATPDMMKVVGGLGRVLGPRGLMPNPKTGTVTNDLRRTIEEYKAGKVNYRAESGGVVHANIGKVSFDVDALVDNFETFYRAVVKAKPSGAKGIYIRKVYLSSTMGPSVRVDMKSIPVEGA
ncbi:MAG TPA: 50S ribosomal protein L1, partial [bacterium]|nr:50S ribosomal protein L1 [bacterium]